LTQSAEGIEKRVAFSGLAKERKNVKRKGIARKRTGKLAGLKVEET
jgi:hypothetical protein